MANFKQDSVENRLIFLLAYEGAENLAIDLRLYAISPAGHLIDANSVWYGKTELCVGEVEMGDALFFVGVNHELNNDDLTKFSLFGAFGFYELSGTLDREARAYRSNPVPERVWRRWLEQSQDTLRNQQVWYYGGPLLTASMLASRSG
jgi:hypothetical protein